MKILIDGDGCPVAGIAVACAKRRGVAAVLICDTAHMMQSDYAECVTVDKGRDSADMVLVNRTNAGDIVVTQDYGLAALCLAKRAVPLNQNGMIYTTENIDRLLMQRHINKKIRMSGGKGSHQKKRTKEQDAAFYTALCKLLDKMTQDKKNG